MNPLDERPKFDLARRLAGELLRLVDDLAAGPAGRHLRRAADAAGRPLLESGEVGERARWTAPALVELIRGLEAAAPHRPCEGCPGPRCPRCHGAGYTPARPDRLARLAVFPTLPTAGDVSDVWGWVGRMDRPDAGSPGGG